MLTPAEKTRELYEHDDLPEELRWIESLAPRHQRLFYGAVQIEWSRYCLTKDAQPLADFFDDWKATSEVDASPEHASYLLADRDPEEYEEWQVKAG